MRRLSVYTIVCNIAAALLFSLGDMSVMLTGMVLNWFRNRRRRRIRQTRFPGEWLNVLEHNCAFYWQLRATEQAKLCSDIQVFVAEKNWEGCGGLKMTDEVRVTIAAQACWLVLGFENRLFERVESILVYPDAYVAPTQTVTPSGMVLIGEAPREGEAWYRGPVILSWADALAGGRMESDGHNVVIHEFAHQLDMENGREVDGIPPLDSAEMHSRWKRVMDRAYDDLIHACDSYLPTVLDCYGTTNRAEFFAVLTECFFTQPHALAGHDDELYDLLCDFFRQDPAERAAGRYEA